MVIFAGLVGAILWNLLTWLLGLPSSSSHALFGGLIGADVGGAPAPAPSTSTRCSSKVLLPAVLSPRRRRRSSPLTATYLAYRITARADAGTRQPGLPASARRVSASMVALAHGTNDAQKTMGVITLTLITAGPARRRLGPAVLGDPRRRAGDRAGHLLGRLADHPDPGQADQRHPDAAGLRRRDRRSAAVILASTHLGLRAVDHAGLHRLRSSAPGPGAGWPSVRWGVAGRIALAWLFTLPAGGGRRRRGVVARRHGDRDGVVVVGRRHRRRRGHLRRVAPQPGHRDNVNDVAAPSPARAVA